MPTETDIAATPETVETKSTSFYLKQATAGQIIEVCKSAFWLWIGLSIFSLFVQFVIQGASGVVNLHAVPSKFLLFCIVPYVSWMSRGTTIPTFTIPKLTFIGWFLFNLFFLLVVLALYIVGLLPWWATPPFYGAVLPLFIGYIALVEKGKANCAKDETA